MAIQFGKQKRQYQQPELFQSSIEIALPPKKANGSVFSDPAFASNKLLPIHRWVPWIAGFSSSFVKDALDGYVGPEGTVLDPFAGVGTTLVEANIQAHDSIGFEINPYAALACRVKSQANKIPIEELTSEICRFDSFYNRKISSGYKPKKTPPEGFKTRTAFYSPKVLNKVLTIWDFIDSVNKTELADLFRLAFASTMVKYSNYSYEPSLGARKSSGKEDIIDFPVGEAISNKLKEMLEDIIWLRESAPDNKANIRIINDSFFKYRDYLKPESIDLIVTSPPYLNNYHYNRNTRPQLYWLGYVSSPKDLIPFENANYGKYWQTVREDKPMQLDFSLPSTDIADKLHSLRGINIEKGAYGGNGWANYATAYFNDCLRFVQGINYVLKPKGTALVVIGNSILQGILIPTDQYFGYIAELVGLELVEIHIPRSTRIGNSIIQSDVRVAKANDKHCLYEAVVELRKH